MNFPFFVAKKYFFSKKSTNVINIISLISLIGVAFGTMAFIIVLSVFNGIENMVTALFNSFDPDLRIELKEGKSFSTDNPIFEKLQKSEHVAYMSYIIEENALLEYDHKQLIATVKAVDDSYKEITGIDTMMYSGDFILRENLQNYAIVGVGIASRLGIIPNSMRTLKIWLPERKEGINITDKSNFRSDILGVSGVFSVQQEYNDKYVIVPINFIKNMTNYGNRATVVEIKLLTKNAKKAEKEIQELLGDEFVVKNRFEQKAFVYKILKSERWAIFAILSFILLVSSFNVIGTMIMLIIEKKKDIETLHAIGADIENIRKIFLFEGWFISVSGAVIGLLLGVGIILLQQTFGFVKLPTSGSFTSDFYPVDIHFIDTIVVFGVVVAIGFLVANYPIRFITRKFFSKTT